MAINVFYNLEHHTLPQVFYCGKTNFFMGAAYNKGFLHQTFNSFFKIAFQNGFIKRKRKFKVWNFKISEKTYNSEHKLLCIHLPKPKACDHTDVYLKTYLISFVENDDIIKVLDIYGLQKHGSKQKEVFVVSFVDGDDEKIVFRGMVKDDPTSIFEYMYKVAFENFYPRVSLLDWENFTNNDINIKRDSLH